MCLVDERFEDASSVDLRRSVEYDLGILATTLRFARIETTRPAVLSLPLRPPPLANVDFGPDGFEDLSHSRALRFA